MSISPRDALLEIHACRPIGPNLITAGQPLESQFKAIREAGFNAVVNLALPTSTGALPNEGSLVTALGMAYVQLPVDFNAPSSADFRAFSGVMEAFSERRIFVHCAANMRVSAFVFLYRVLRCGTAEADAKRDLDAIWEPDQVWQKFIDDELMRGRKQKWGIVRS